MKEEDIKYLLIDEHYAPVSEDDFKGIKTFAEDFIEDYEKNQDKDVEVWLSEKLTKELPEKSSEEINSLVTEIVESVKTFELEKSSLEEHVSTGRSKESWFAKKIKEVTSRMSTEQTVQYLQGLDNAINTANESLARTLIAQSTGKVSNCYSLHGYIAEREHVNTFNLNAETTGSPYRAEVIEHSGEAFTKNGVDIKIIDTRTGSGKAIQKYQSKYNNDPQQTNKALERYKFQRPLVPPEQKGQINHKCTDHLEAPDGTSSEPLSYKRSKDIQKRAQKSGKWNDKNWNDYKTKDIAVGIGKQAGQAALLGAAIGAGTEVVEKLWKGEKIEGKEVAKKAVEGGADFGVKATITGAIKAGAEKGVIRCIPKGTPAGAIANVVSVGVENAKILYKYGKGEITGSQALEKMEETTVSAAGGMIAMECGAAKGVAIGMAVGGPVGAAIGGFIGGTVAYMAGSAAGKVVVAASRKVTSVAEKAVSSIVQTAKSTVSTVASTVASVSRSIASALKFW